MAQVKWNGKQVDRAVTAALFDGLRKAADFEKTVIQKRISKSANIGRGRISPKRGGGKPRRFQASKAGEPPRARTGALRQSIFASSSRRELAATIGTTKKYGLFMERGSRPHVIRPRRKKALVFGGWVQKQAEFKIGTAVSIGTRQIVRGGVKKRKGERSEWDWVFRGAVNHPGTKPRPYIWSTIWRDRVRMNAIVISTARTRIASIGGSISVRI